MTNIPVRRGDRDFGDLPEHTTDVVAVLDQVSTTMENTAKIVGTYFKSLVDSGIPEKTALELTKEWHTLFWSSKFGLIIER